MARSTAVLGSVLMLAWAVLTGCSVRSGGRAVPADNEGPRPVPASALHDALLAGYTVNDIMGASRMGVQETRSRMFDGSPQFADRGCMVAWTPAEQTVYAHSGWTAVVAQTLSETAAKPNHFVIQAAVTFASRRNADDFFTRTAQRWAACGEKSFVSKRGRGEAGGSWTFDAVSSAESTLWMTQRQDRSSGWSCQRALRVVNNVAIDVLACKFYAADEAVTITHGIDARLPSG